MRQKREKIDVAASLDELLSGQDSIIEANRQRERIRQSTVSNLRMIERARIVVEDQVRTQFPREQLEGLRNNIREMKERGEGIEATGLLQPLAVIPIAESENFLLVIGERRFRASEPDGSGDIPWDDSWVGLEKLPCLITATKPAGVRLLQLVENLQRQDLNPLEEARAIQSLMDEQNLSQRDVAKVIGQSRGYVTDRLMLLDFGKDVQDMVVARATTSRHAREIQKITDAKFRRSLIRAVLDEDASVAEIHRRIEEHNKPTETAVSSGDMSLQNAAKLTESGQVRELDRENGFVQNGQQNISREISLGQHHQQYGPQHGKQHQQPQTQQYTPPTTQAEEMMADLRASRQRLEDVNSVIAAIARNIERATSSYEIALELGREAAEASKLARLVQQNAERLQRAVQHKGGGGERFP